MKTSFLALLFLSLLNCGSTEQFTEFDAPPERQEKAPEYELNKRLEKSGDHFFDKYLVIDCYGEGNKCLPDTYLDYYIDDKCQFLGSSQGLVFSKVSPTTDKVQTVYTKGQKLYEARTSYSFGFKKTEEGCENLGRLPSMNIQKEVTPETFADILVQYK